MNDAIHHSQAQRGDKTKQKNGGKKKEKQQCK
jgi:hypothetical protein